MTKEENLHWLNQEIRTWENECQSKHPIKEALYAARKALEQEPTLEKDGTLIVTTEHYKNVGRVLVQCGTNGALFYQDQDPTTKNDIRDNRVKNELNRVKDELEPTTKNCESCRYYGSHHEVCNYCYKCSLWTEKEPTTKNDLGVDVISRADALLVAKNEYLRGWHDALCKALCEEYSIHCEEGNFSVIQEETITGLGLSMDCAVGKDVEDYMSTIPSATPQKSNTGYISIDDVMSVFDDFMCGDVDEEGVETFWEMLKDKAESEEG